MPDLPTRLARKPMRRHSRLGRTGAKAKRLQAEWEASKKAVLARAGNRCENPWCRRTTRLDVHHIVKRSRGRDDSPLNLVALCRACHRGTDEWLDIHTFVDGLGRTYACFGEAYKPVRSLPLGEIS